jgi:hypothetical protein
MTYAPTILLFLGFLQVPAGGQTGQETLRKVVDRFSAVRDYTVTLDIVADMERLHVPPMHVTLSYKHPDRFHFDSEGFALLPRDGMALNPAKFLSRYTVLASGPDSLKGRLCTRITLQPNAEKDKLRIVFLTIDPIRFTIEQIETPLFDGRTMTAVFEYDLHSGHWMPSQANVTFAASEKDTAEVEPHDQTSPIQTPRLPRTGTVSIRYSGYRINIGLPEEVFEKNEKQPKE